MTQADGHYTETGDLRYRFKKIRKIERAKHILRQAGIIYIINKHSDDSYTITIKRRDIPLYLRLFSEKKIGFWLLNENADIIFEELEQWDAYRCGPNSIQYTTTEKINADVIQALAALSGRSCTIVTKNRTKENPNWNTAYLCNIWLNPGKHSEIRREFVSREQFSGKVYCATTLTGFFLVRRNGKVWITGNSGRLVQLQNLPQNHLSDLDYARYLVKRGDLEEFEMNYDNVTQVLSELIRTAFIAKPGCTFHVCDFSAIEARVIAWIAGEQWVLDAFRQGHDIYCETASRMFGVPVEKHGVNGHLRQRGKVAVLGLGYGGGVNALEAMGGSRMGLTETEMKNIVDKWRESNPKIVKLWRIVEKAVIAAVKTGRSIPIHQNIVIGYRWGVLLITLPSGRTLCYPRARIISETNRWGNEHEVITYEGINQTRGLDVVFHIHDEIIVETTPDRTLQEVEALFSEPIAWCRNLPLKGAGYTTPYYLKD